MAVIGEGRWCRARDVAQGDTSATSEQTAPWSRLRGLVEGQEIPEQQPAGFEGLAKKDLAAAQQLASDVGVATPLIDTVTPQLRAVFLADLS